MTTAKPGRSIRLLGKTAPELDRISGSPGEIFLDSTNQTLRLYNGSTVGGTTLGGSLTTEQVQDIAAGLFNTAQSGVTVSYNDGAASLTLTVANQTWSQITSKPTFATVATTGSYTDLTNRPTIPTNTNQLTNGAGYITSTGIASQTDNSGKYLTTDGSATSWGTITITAAGVGLGNVTNESKATMFASPTFTGNSSVTGSLNVGQTILTSRFLSSPYQLVVPRGPVYQGTGVLSTLTTAIATNDYPEGIAVDPTSRFVYVANRSGGVGLFSINQTTGVLTGGSIQSAGTTPYAVTVDPTGRFLYVTNSGSASVSQFSINQTTGALTSITTAITTGTQPVGIAVDPTGRFVYVTNNSVNTVSQFSINQTTGALTSITTAIASGANPYGIAVDPTGRFVYVTNNGGTSVSQYSIDQTTGALTSITTAIASGAGGFPLGVAVDPTGRFVYVANRNNSTVSQYLINQTTGALTTITTPIALPASAGPGGVTVDPTGRFVYVVNEYFDTVSQLLINQTTGALTTITTAIASGDRPVTVIVDPTGRFVYVVNQHGFGGNQPGSISQYSINNFSAGQSIISSPVNSTNTQTGALQVVGGVGVGGNLNVGGGVKLIAPSGDKSFSIDAAGYSNALIIEHNGVNGYISSYGTNGDLYIRTGSGKSVRMDSTAASTSTTTGALTVAGGVGVGGNLNVGGTLAVTGSTSGSITLQAGATPAAQTYTLPSAYPAANGYALVSTTGGALSWTSVDGPAFRAVVAVAQAITSGSQQKVTFGTETFDTNANFATSRFTPTVEGYYQLNSTVRLAGASTTGECMITLWKNGAEYARGTNTSGAEQGTSFYSMQVSDLAYANGTSDYFEVYIQQTSTANKDTTVGANISYFSGAMIRGA